MRFLPNKLLLNILAFGLVISSSFNGLFGAAEKPKTMENQTKAQEKWQTYAFQKSGFSVDLPTKPETLEQTIDIPKSDLKITYETYLSEPSDNSVFVISVWNYPAEIDMSKPEVNLQDGFGGMLSALPGSEVEDMKMTEVDGFKALEFLVKNEDIYFQGKLILVHNTLYQVFTVYKSSVDMDKSYSKFIDSFKLLNPEKRKAKNGKEPQKMNV